MIKTPGKNTFIFLGRFSWWQRWPQRIGYATMTWSLSYCILSFYWTLGGKDFPFGVGDPHPEYSILRGLPVEAGAPVITLLTAIGVGTALLMTHRQGRGVFNTLCSAFAWSMAGILLLLIPDDRLLACLAHALLLHFEMFDWTVVNQFYCIAGGILWGATSLVSQRQIRHACEHCGRNSKVTSGWTAPHKALQWGRWAGVLAVVIPFIYCVTRWAFALGIPLGVSQHFLRTMAQENPGIWLGGAAIATLGLGGALLTLGLIQSWGENFPQWMRGLAGKRVPPMLAIIPASLVSILVLEAGLGWVRHALSGGFAFAAAEPATYLPGLLWPLWGLAVFSVISWQQEQTLIGAPISQAPLTLQQMLSKNLIWGTWFLLGGILFCLLAWLARHPLDERCRYR